MAEVRTNRDLTTRVATGRTAEQRWTPPDQLPMPEDRPGWAHRWVRLSLGGNSDPANISLRLREGWEPVKATDYPEIAMVTEEGQGRWAGNVVMGGLMLCRMPREMADSRDAHYQDYTKARLQAADSRLVNLNDPRMPLFNQRDSKVVFGNGN